jgi:hypothetical protein
MLQMLAFLALSAGAPLTDALALLPRSNQPSALVGTLRSRQIATSTAQLRRRRDNFFKHKRSPSVGLAKRAEAGNTSLAYIEGGYVNSFVFDLQAHIGGQGPFYLVADPASSDTWLVAQEFQCFDLNNTAISQAGCKFGNEPLYDSTKSSTFQEVAGVNFSVGYNDHEMISGPAASDTFRIGTFVFKQTFGLANVTAWLGDGSSDGLSELVRTHSEAS